MKGRNTRIVSARIPDDLYDLMVQRAVKRQVSVNAWLLWAVKEGLRDRHRQYEKKSALPTGTYHCRNKAYRP